MSNDAWSRQRILLTGVNGFIGTHLVRHLKKLGCNNISCLHRNRTNNDETASQLIFEQLMVNSFSYDKSYKSVDQAFHVAKPIIVIHLASLFLASHRADQIQELIESNVLLGTYLAEAAVTHGCAKFVNVGTVWQHYRSSDYQPVNLYAATKQAFEDILLYYSDSSSLNVTTALLSDTYGPGDTRRKIISMLLDCALSQNPLDMSLGQQQLDLTHVSDVVQSLAEIALQGQQVGLPHARYRVCSGQTHSLREIAGIVEEVTERSLPINWGARSYRSREVMQHHASAPIFQTSQPFLSLREGLRQLWLEKISKTRHT